jgi:Fe-S cluster biosynthesis and repair protein YggX
MTREVFCIKLKKQAPGLSRVPYPGPLGQRIFEEISQEMWKEWLVQQTRLINEYRLNLLDETAQKFLETEMEKFLFGEGSAPPPGWTAQ